MKSIHVLSFFAILFSFASSSAFAWEVELEHNPHLPTRFIGIAKAQKHLYIFEKQSPLQLTAVFPSIHGEKEGDKEFEGDLKTPEGIYFVTTKIKTELDFTKYGSGAYALNYPNPVDKIKQKTGYGIWIHSKGDPIEGQVTQGCVAVDLDNFATLADYLPSGTPIVLADTIISPVTQEFTPEIIVPEDAETHQQIADHLIELTKNWNTKWAARSEEFFDFYNPALYSKAQDESFASFKAQKEGLFKVLSWIQIIHGDIYALEGPDYWVTYFSQFYKAPNLTSEGTRRLYWQPDEKGEFRIVGMEWLPAHIGLEEVYIAAVQPEIEAILEGWKQAWLLADIGKYSTYYAENAIQSERIGQEIFAQKTELWQKKQPKSLDLSQVKIFAEGSHVRVQFKQTYVDSSGYKDVGMKNILFEQVNGTWLISREDWRKI